MARLRSLLLGLFALAAFLLFTLVFATRSASAQATVLTLDDRFALERIAADLAFPTSIAFAPPPDDRVFVVERFTGAVRILQGGALLPAPCVTIPGVATAGEQGLLNVELDPAFAANGFLYVYYTEAAGPPVPIEPTWRSIQDQIFNVSCASCHAGATPPGALALTESASYAALVGVPSVQVPALDRVEAFNPDDSYLVRKIEDHPAIVGDPMPPTGALLSQDKLDAVRQWIANGAPYNPGDPSNPPQAFRNRVVRYTVVGNACGDPSAILDDIPASNTHNGGAIAFAPDGTLFIQAGDANALFDAQNSATLNGKILRVAADGSIPANNPLVGVPGAREEVYSLGHRNGFGIAPDFHAPQVPPRVYVSENGPTTWDEVNVVRAGLNYGWPTWLGIVGQPGFTDPIVAWGSNPVSDPTVSPTGIVRYAGAAYAAEFAGDVFVAWLRNIDVDPNPLVNQFATIVRKLEIAPGGNALVSEGTFLAAQFPGGKTQPIELVAAPDGRIWLSVVAVTTTGLGDLWRLNWIDDDFDGCPNPIDPAPGVFSPDGDGDRYGADCDCVDSNPAVNPGAAEICGNGLDDDCVGGDQSCGGGCAVEPAGRVGGAAAAGAAGVLAMLVGMSRRRRRS